MTKMTIVSYLLTLTALAPSVRGDFITGQVVDAQGMPLAGVDIDVENQSGDNPDIFNDGTDAGGFFLTTVPDGTFDIVFNPPQPAQSPGANSLIRVVPDVAIAGTLDMGVITLEQGAVLTGRFLGTGGLPAPGVNLDVIDASGQNILLRGDHSDSFGEFTMVVPFGPIEVLADTEPVPGQTLAPHRMDVNLSADGSLGDVQLEPGFVVSALVLSGGSGVEDADVDATDTTTGEVLYTPGDNADEFGLVDFVVPAGTYDFDICTEFATGLAPQRISNVAVAAHIGLGIVDLQPGHVLSGTILSHLANPVPGADVDLNDATTGASIPLCNDDAGLDGTYAVVVPPGTYDVQLSPPYHELLATQTLGSITIAADTTLDGNLPPCPAYTNYGTGTPGAGGFIPQLESFGGAPRLGNPDYGVHLSSATGGAQALLAVALDAPPQAPLPFSSGLHFLIHDFTGPRILSGSLSGPDGLPGIGEVDFQVPVPSGAAFAGRTLFARAYIRDVDAPEGLARSAGLNTTYCD